MVRAMWSLAAALMLLPVWAGPSPAQVLPEELQRAAVGSAVGVAGGTVITISAIVARARFQREFLDSVDDLIHWQTIPMIAAPAAGAVFGLAGRDALVGSMIGSTAGLLVGAAVGTGLAMTLSNDDEWHWASGIMGAGLGLTVGGIAGGLLGWSRDDDPDLDYPGVLRFGLAVPVP